MEELPAIPPAAPPVHPPVSEPAGNSASGEVLNQVLPEVSQTARDTIHGKLRVSVRASVDASGHVAAARLDYAGPSKYFAAKTLEAARRWVFQPPRVLGQEVASEWILRFGLTRDATEVRPVRISPR